MRFLLRHLPLNLLLVIPLLPLIGVGLLVGGALCTLADEPLVVGDDFWATGSTSARPGVALCGRISPKVTEFPVVAMRLRQYLESSDAEVWLITGSPQRLVEQVYHDSNFIHRLRLIGSRMERRNGDGCCHCAV